MSKPIKKPRLFYWEDAEDCFCVANNEDFPGLISEMIRRGVLSENLCFYFMDFPDENNALCYDVGSATLKMVEGSIENYISIDDIDEGEDIELSVKIQYMTDTEFQALPEI